MHKHISVCSIAIGKERTVHSTGLVYDNKTFREITPQPSDITFADSGILRIKYHTSKEVLSIRSFNLVQLTDIPRRSYVSIKGSV
jgi:hypothetical protein